MDSLLHIETKKQKLRQTDEDFNFHSVSLLSQAPLACGSSALTEPLFYVYEIKFIYTDTCMEADGEISLEHLFTFS